MKTGPWTSLEATKRRLQVKVVGIARQLRGMTIGVGIIGASGSAVVLHLAWIAVAAVN